MADLKINQQTGEIAVPTPDGKFRILKRSEYKFNAQTNEFALPKDGGGWEIVPGRAGPTKDAAAAERTKTERASILPFSRNVETGEVDYFDPKSGILGAILSGVTLPGDVASGKVNPESQESIARMLDFTTLAAPVNPAIRAGSKIIPGVTKALVPERPKAPTVDALKEAAESAYEAVRTMGVDYSSQAVKSLSDDIARELQDKGILAELAPKTFSVLNKLDNPPADSVASIEGLVAARRALNNAGGDFTNPTERLAANRVIDRLDEFLMGRDEASVVAGPAASAGKALEEARGNYAAAKRSEKVTGAEERAELNAAVANSGANVDNQIRQRIRDLVTRPKDARGYSQQEIEFMKQVARGTFGSNAARYMGNLLGGGGGLGAIVTGALTGSAAGAAGGSPAIGTLIGTLLPTLGVGSKKLSAFMVRKQLNTLDEMIRMRSPLYEQMRANPSMVPAGVGLRQLPVRGLMLTRPPYEEDVLK